MHRIYALKYTGASKSLINFRTRKRIRVFAVRFINRVGFLRIMLNIQRNIMKGMQLLIQSELKLILHCIVISSYGYQLVIHLINFPGKRVFFILQTTPLICTRRRTYKGVISFHLICDKGVLFLILKYNLRLFFTATFLITYRIINKCLVLIKKLGT